MTCFRRLLLALLCFYYAGTARAATVDTLNYSERGDAARLPGGGGAAGFLCSQ